MLNQPITAVALIVLGVATLLTLAYNTHQDRKHKKEFSTVNRVLADQIKFETERLRKKVREYKLND